MNCRVMVAYTLSFVQYMIMLLISPHDCAAPFQVNAVLPTVDFVCAVSVVGMHHVRTVACVCWPVAGQRHMVPIVQAGHVRCVGKPLSWHICLLQLCLCNVMVWARDYPQVLNNCSSPREC